MKTMDLKFIPVYMVDYHGTEIRQGVGAKLEKFRDNSYGNISSKWLIFSEDTYTTLSTVISGWGTNVFDNIKDATARLEIEKANHVESLRKNIVATEEQIKKITES